MVVEERELWRDGMSGGWMGWLHEKGRRVAYLHQQNQLLP